VSLEHAATGAAQIVPGYGTCAEVWRGAAVSPGRRRRGRMSLRGTRSDESGVAEQIEAKLESLYVDGEFRRRVAEAGYRNATDPKDGWGRIARQWDESFEKVLGG
jgi:D-inositol-3-phosphate glycosyltransferase